MKNAIDIKVIFTDIDWTILDHRTRPPKFDKKSIKYLSKLQNKGIKVFLCTARPYHSLKQIGLLDFFTPDGLILANGGLIIIDDKVIYKTVMPNKEFEDLCALAKSLNVNIEGIRTHDCFLISPADDPVRYLFMAYPEAVPPVEDYHNQEVIGATLFAPKEYDEAFQKHLKKGSHYFRYHDFGVDIASEIHDKGVAIDIVLKTINVSKDNAFAIGDDNADISMFNVVKYGVAIGNAKDEVKEAANYITKPVHKHGLRHILKKLL